MRITGLGTTLSASQIYQTAVGAGFPPDVATQMTAIALHESRGVSTATNITTNPKPGYLPEQSYGLWQINIQGNPQIMSQLGITDPSQLLDPATNAKAAYLLWGGNPNNLNVAWGINNPNDLQGGYQQFLPAAEAAAAANGYDASSLSTTSASTDPTTSVDLASVLPDLSTIDFTDPVTIGLIAVSIGAVVYLANR